MGVYTRADSPFYWLLLERPDRKPLREATKIPVRATTAMQRKLLRDQAQEAYNLRMTELARTGYELPVASQTTIAFDKYADWFTTHHLPKRRGAVRDAASLKNLRAFFGKADLTEIDRARVAEYETARLADRVGPVPADGQQDTRRTVNPATINREVDLLKSMLRDAVPKYLKASPLVGFRRLRTIKRKKRVLSEEEEVRLLSALPPADQAFYILAVDTLMRFSNVYNLKRCEDHRTHLALEDSKTGPYEVPLSGRARKALDSLPTKGEYFFEHRRTAKNIHNARTAYRHLLERACRRAGIPYGRLNKGITFHSATRATGATRMLRKGVDPKTVQEIGNWKSLEQMGDYLVTDMARKRAAVNQIGPIPITPHSRKRAEQRKLRPKAAETA